MIRSELNGDLVRIKVLLLVTEPQVGHSFLKVSNQISANLLRLGIIRRLPLTIKPGTH